MELLKFAEDVKHILEVQEIPYSEYLLEALSNPPDGATPHVEFHFGSHCSVTAKKKNKTYKFMGKFLWI